ncbi:MAG: DUF2236 domain-containing protein [Gordonia sp.]|nr:DUF2236 domain-containing protein [Gordonia sp. (in: high G+C Gram-positive bacteria)]
MTASDITGATNWDSVRARHPELVDKLDAGLGQGDPLAEAAISEMVGLADFGWRQLTRILEDPLGRMGEAPPALRALLDTASSPPPWFEQAVAEAGGRAWWKFGTLQSSTLYQSLIYGYQARGFVRPLVATGQLADHTYDRVLSTGRWVALATAPGQMAPGSPGWSQTLKIRLIHAMVRHSLLVDEDWNVAEWGVPINQTYSALTIGGGFLALPMMVAGDLGIHYSAAEREAIAHLWRWIGWVIGVDDALLPKNFAAAQQLFDIGAQFELEPDESSKMLTRALLREGYRIELPLVPDPVTAIVNVMLRPVLSTSFSAISTRWVEKPAAGKMGLRRSPLHHLVDVARPAVRLREVVRAIGLLGNESQVVNREMRTVMRGLGMNAAEIDKIKTVA